MSVCPNCGYCPHCGRSNTPYYPYWPYWQRPVWHQPVWYVNNNQNISQPSIGTSINYTQTT